MRLLELLLLFHGYTPFSHLKMQMEVEKNTYFTYHFDTRGFIYYAVYLPKTKKLNEERDGVVKTFI